jgi:hypothetical protein
MPAARPLVDVRLETIGIASVVLPVMAPAEKAAALDELIRRVITPYACVGSALVALGFLVRWSPLPEIDTEHESADVAEANADKTGILQFPHLILGALGMVALGAAGAAFRRAAHPGGGDTGLIGAALGVIAVACIAVAGWNLYQRWGRPGR